MNEQELEKFVEDQYKTWFDNNDISKVEDIDQKDLKGVFEKDLSFVSKMTVQEYTLYENGLKYTKNIKQQKQIVSLMINILKDPTQEHLLNQLKIIFGFLSHQMI